MLFPDVFYFPFNPNFSFSLISDKSNTVEVAANIIFPKTAGNEGDEGYQVFFVDWKLSLNMENQKLDYLLHFTILSNGDVYLSSIRDELYQRSLYPEALVFPKNVNFDKPIFIGENISLKYSKFLSYLKIKESGKSYNNVRIADLTLGDSVYTLYFAQYQGIVAIKGPDEVYRIK
jgi:hypothetical protein